MLRTSPDNDVLELLREAKIPCTPDQSIDHVVAAPHVAACGMLTEATDPFCGDILQTRMPIGDANPPRPAPTIGQHSREILAELGYGDREIDEFVQDETVNPAADRSKDQRAKK